MQFFNNSSDERSTTYGCISICWTAKHKTNIEPTELILMSCSSTTSLAMASRHQNWCIYCSSCALMSSEWPAHREKNQQKITCRDALHLNNIVFMSSCIVCAHVGDDNYDDDDASGASFFVWIISLWADAAGCCCRKQKAQMRNKHIDYFSGFDDSNKGSIRHYSLFLEFVLLVCTMHCMFQYV